MDVRQIEKHSRSAARMAAVQAVYQMETAETGVERIIAEFKDYWIPEGTKLSQPHDHIDKLPQLHHADQEFFTRLVRGVVETQRRIDPYLERQLAKNWTLKRIDATVRAILRCGLYEMIRLSEVPGKVILDEYINIAHAFFDEEEPKFINGVLNAAAQEARSDEFVL